jgi:hypothetical protein
LSSSITRALRRSALIPIACLLCACLPAGGQAAQTVALHTSFTPDRLGASTTIGFGFTIGSTDGGLPSPLTHVALRMPAGMNYLTTDLGLAVCKPKRLIEKGLSGCSPNSRLGFGDAFVEVPFGTGTGREIPDIQALMGPEHNGNIVVLFYADGRAPVYAQLVFQGELRPAGGGFGEDLDTAIPLIPSVPNGPPVSIIKVDSTIGPAHLLYVKRVHGRVVHYRPRGVSLPETCPKGGFHFVGEFSFQDGSVVTASSSVPCPRGGRSHRRGK